MGATVAKDLSQTLKKIEAVIKKRRKEDGGAALISAAAAEIKDAAKSETDKKLQGKLDAAYMKLGDIKGEATKQHDMYTKKLEGLLREVKKFDKK